MNELSELRSKFSKDHLSSLSSRGRKTVFSKGETVFLRDDPGQHIVIVIDGLIEVSLTSTSGRKSVLAHIGPGELIGEVSVLDNAPRSADAVALKRCQVVLVPRSNFLLFLSENPSAMVQLLEALCARIRNASDMFETRSLTSAKARLARCIVLLARKWGEESGGTTTVVQRFSQTEIGSLAGLARENVNRYMQQWKTDGWISFENGRLEILDMDALIDESETTQS